MGKFKILLEKYKKAIDDKKDCNDDVENALWHILNAHENDVALLFENNPYEYFHKGFRQCDIVEGYNGHIDMCIWFLLNHVELFWEVLESM